MSDATSGASAKAGFADLAEIFYAPRAVFERRSDGKFGIPYAALVILGIVIMLATKNLMQPVMDAIVSSSVSKMVAAGKLPADRADAAISMGRTTAMILPLAFFIVGPFLVACFLWLGGKIAGIERVGTVAVMIATFSMFPRIIGTIASAVMISMAPEGSMTNPAQLSLGPGHFLGADASPVIATLAGRLDIFLVWGVVLMAIGLEAAAKAPRAKAWTAAILTWGIISLISIGSVLRQG